MFVHHPDLAITIYRELPYCHRRRHLVPTQSNHYILWSGHMIVSIIFVSHDHIKYTFPGYYDLHNSITSSGFFLLLCLQVHHTNTSFSCFGATFNGIHPFRASVDVHKCLINYIPFHMPRYEFWCDVMLLA
jgi:hypothetical protein